MKPNFWTGGFRFFSGSAVFCWNAVISSCRPTSRWWSTNLRTVLDENQIPLLLPSTILHNVLLRCRARRKLSCIFFKQLSINCKLIFCARFLLDENLIPLLLPSTNHWGGEEEVKLNWWTGGVSFFLWFWSVLLKCGNFELPSYKQMMTDGFTDSPAA